VLAAVRRHPVQLAGDGLAQGALADQQVLPGRAGAVLEVGHVAAGARVQGVDDHLRIDRTGDLDAAVLQRGRQRRHGPVALADGAGVFAEVRTVAGVEADLTLLAGGQAGLAGGLEAAVQVDQEGLGGRRQQVLLAGQARAGQRKGRNGAGCVSGHGHHSWGNSMDRT